MSGLFLTPPKPQDGSMIQLKTNTCWKQVSKMVYPESCKEFHGGEGTHVWWDYPVLASFFRGFEHVAQVAIKPPTAGRHSPGSR